MTEGHNGPHGVHIGSGVVLAPHGGGEGGFIDGESDSELLCESCGAKMRSKKFTNGGGILTCTKCKQNWAFQLDGSSSCVSTTVWPSGMKETDATFRDYVAWQLKQWIFKTNARCELGLIDDVERARRIAEGTKTVEDWKQTHPPKLGFWRTLFKSAGVLGEAV